MKNFILAFIQVFLVSINVKFISSGNVWGVVLTSFAISYVWAHNVKKNALGTEYDRLIYASGAAVGAYVAYILTN